jgi:serine/threonine-protein kinase
MDDRLAEGYLEYERLKAEGPVDVEALLARYPDVPELRPAIEMDRGGVPGAREWKNALPPLPGPDDEGPPLGPFGTHHLEKRIGRGGMGIVYRARHVMLGRCVALKVVREGANATPDDRARFLNEARDVVDLAHPNIVQVHDVGICGGYPYFCMELAKGTLAEQAAGRTPAEIARLMEQVARAVHHAHERGVLHRDLKPANILIMADGTPKVADFGLAKRIKAAPAPPPTPAGLADTACYVPADGRTAAGAVLGTPPYMPPEQARGEQATTAADVYGLGAVLYELLTGHPPFQGSGPLDTLALVLNKEPVAPRATNPDACPDLEALCLKCLAKAPSERPPSALAVAEDLADISSGRGSRYRPRDAWDWLRHSWHRVPPRAEYTWWKLLVIAAIGLVCHGLVTYAALSGKPLVWVWAGWVGYAAASLLLNWVVTLIRFRSVPAEQHTASMCSVAYILAFVATMIGGSPADPWAPAAAALPLYPALTAIAGITFFVLGVTFWGRLMLPGLVVFALAAVIRFTGDYGPLLHAVVNAVILCWWSWVAYYHFLPCEGPRRATPA